MKSKSIYLAIFSLFIFNFSISQEFRGKAYYQSKRSMSDMKIENNDLSPELAVLVQEKLAKSFENSFVLSFTKSESIFQEEEILEADNKPSGNIQINAMTIGGDNNGKLYKNLKTQQTLKEEDIMGKEFLVSSSLRVYDWQINEETKKIGDYLCQKAVCIIPVSEEQKKAVEDIKKQVSNSKASMIQINEPKDEVFTVWFTTEVPVSNGPADFWGLPGLILEANDGDTTYLCSKIVLNPKEKFEIKTPNKGKKVTVEEFSSIAKKQLDDFKENNLGGFGEGTKTIRIER